MQRPSFYTIHTAILFAVGCLLLSMGLVTGVHAQQQTQQQTQAQATSPQPAAVTDSTAAASINLADSTVQPAQTAARERELIRAHRSAHRMERRMMISESTGISLGELDDLLRKIGPTAEERDNHERRTQTGQLSVEDLDENP